MAQFMHTHLIEIDSSGLLRLYSSSLPMYITNFYLPLHILQLVKDKGLRCLDISQL